MERKIHVPSTEKHSGLTMDYLNKLSANLNSIKLLKEKIGEEMRNEFISFLTEDLMPYDLYYLIHSPDEFERLMASAKPESLALFNRKVDEYNSFSKSSRFSETFQNIYLNEFEMIIKVTNLT